MTEQDELRKLRALLAEEEQIIANQEKLIVKQIVRQVAKCTSCGKKENENQSPVFVKAGVSSPVLSHSFSTPSLVAQVMYLKFMLGVPFNRQEKEWFRMGLVLTRADMVYWVIRCSEEWLASIYQKIHEQLLKCEVLHMMRPESNAIL